MLWIHETDHDRDMIEDRLQNLLLLPQIPLRPLALADVLSDANRSPIGKADHGPTGVDDAPVFDRGFEVRPFRIRALDEVENALALQRIGIALLIDVHALVYDLVQCSAQHALPLAIHHLY